VKTFTKWFIINAIVATCAFLASQKGLFGIIFENDVSYMSSVIMLVYFVFSGFTGLLCKRLDNLKSKPDNALLKNLKITEFVADNFTTCGLLGTTIGMSIMMFSTLDGNADVGTIIKQLKVGCSTAFFTTIVGIAANVFLNIQLLLIKHSIKGNLKANE
jgi:hypothetical protein